MEIIPIVACETILGEGPLWDVEQQKLYWIDSFGMKIFRSDASGGNCESWDVPQKVGSMALREHGGAILSLADGFYLFDFESGSTSLISKVLHRTPDVRLNDGKVDRAGRFIAGSMDTTETQGVGILYSLDKSHRLTELDRGIVVSNGPCWSPDGSTFYFSDSRSRTIWAYDYDNVTGKVCNKRVFAIFGDGDGFPDGATVDSEGCVWSAGVYAGKIHRFAPDGQLIESIQMPVVCVSSVMFGGPKLDTLYATTMSSSPVPDVIESGEHAGSLFAITGLDVTGVPERRFVG
ncbi:SMP-30/gluconolactonase/LRE family protein [Burkholderia aenigmatica]|uniref:Calcium-binding protein n=1 Tax=Burkholderia aenigmatica TaxID=2015348 RepID=A0A228IN80_9BURK|nr:SMP-30/gluconolactonase/LRE family protein [Burkholderia aenigmatica]OXI43837.1 calcium-binding protein [Burkholderia aenigmatica]